ncbi:MAG: SRPBCC family protein [Magnetovibrio sp.]|nr:SRPBCC family protein [Magnetovibrio sp.]
MTETVHFERSHSIEIAAQAAAILDYVSNPNSWPEWIAASHAIHSPDRPLQAGDTFWEEWRTRKGGARLDWRVTERDHPHHWTAETGADFIGPIIVRYDIAELAGGCRFTRTVTNPARPKPPTAEMVERIDAEAEAALANIKRAVEAGA